MPVATARVGALATIELKRKSDRRLAGETVRGGETGFILLLFLAGTSGLARYAFGGTGAAGWVTSVRKQFETLARLPARFVTLSKDRDRMQGPAGCQWWPRRTTGS